MRFQKIFSYEPLEHFTLKREMSVRFRVLNKIGQRFEIGFALGTTETSFITMLTYHMRFKLGHGHHCVLFTGLQNYLIPGKSRSFRRLDELLRTKLYLVRKNKLPSLSTHNGHFWLLEVFFVFALLQSLANFFLHGSKSFDSGVSILEKGIMGKSVFGSLSFESSFGGIHTIWMSRF